MPFRRAARRITSWIAVLAVLMASLAPALSQALAATGSGSWVEVCTLEGARWVKGDTDASRPSAPAVEHAFEHCPCCSLHADSPGLPPAARLPLPATCLAHAVPLAFLAAPRTLHAWASAQPRAPPSVS